MIEKRIRNIITIQDHRYAGAIAISLKDREKFEIFNEENVVIPVPKSEQQNEIYQLIKENCDMKFCTEETSDDFKFITLE